MLPKIKELVLQDLNFPRDFQTVIFRNYSFVPTERIAKVLKTSREVVDAEAKRLGLSFEENYLAFEKKGYLTVIRNNWFILSYEDIVTLLDISEKKLEFILTEEDFFANKLGDVKPKVEKVVYSPLSDEEICETERIAKTVKKYFNPKKVKPFDFFSDLKAKNPQTAFKSGNSLIIHGYLSPCGNAFLSDSREYLPDELLTEYARLGVNGIWIHGVLSTLSFNPFDPETSKGYESNRKNLKDLVERAKKFGIKIYLYLNEPRRLPIEKFVGQKRLMGTVKNGFASLCTSVTEVKEYLYNAVKDLVEYVGELGGIFNITMSENLTHCKSHVWTECPRCKNIPVEELCAEVINIMAKAVKDSGTDTELIANLWGWSPFLEWTENQIFRGISLLDKSVSVMETSEYWLQLDKGGVGCNVIDYSLSNPGPSELTAKKLSYAKSLGHKIYAKVQVNNSWECSAVPFVPAFDLVYEHLVNLKKLGVQSLFMSWTLGGYPSVTLELVKEFYRNDDFSLKDFYARRFSESESVRKAVKLFSEGFRQYPFSVYTLYYSPHTLGAANLWSLRADEKNSSMVCYAFDDYENYIKPYPYAVYVRQYKKMLSRMKKSLDVFAENSDDERVKKLYDYASVAYLHFKSDYLQTRFARYKRNKNNAKSKEVLSECLKKIKEVAEQLIRLADSDTYIGYEASNHYFYTERNLIEKIINTDKLAGELSEEKGDK